MKTLSFTFLGFCTLFFIASCTKYVGADPALLPKPFVLICDSVKYNKDIQPIINSNCATPGCHVPGGTGSGVFTDYNGVFAKVTNGSFKMRVIDGTPGYMPVSGRLPDSLIAKIQCWLNAGAPNN